MKFCANCGATLVDEAVFCPACGSAVEAGITMQQPVVAPAKESGLSLAAKILMIIGTIITAISTFGVGLAWTLPMTISYCNKIKRGAKIGTGFKVCSLLFVNTIAGILMFCDSEH